jgi:phage shock protein PspC (stress-responsive transcriptional regulator)
MGAGVLWLLANLGVLPGLWGALWGVIAVIFWPAVLIGAGYLLLRANSDRNIDQAFGQAARRMKEAMGNAMPGADELQARMNQMRARISLRRSRTNRMVLGVCGGIGEKLGVDANLIRLIWVAVTLGSMGLGLLLYVGLAILMPEEQTPASTNGEVQHIQVMDRETHH